MNVTSAQQSQRGKRASGFTLMELMVVVALSAILLTFAASLWLFGSRSFEAMGNYTDLDAKSRNALDLMSRDIRQATAVTDFQNTRSSKQFTVTNATAGTASTYTWNAARRTLVCSKTGQPNQVYLTECDLWAFQFFQRTPQAGGTYNFFPATNAAGAYDLSTCKLINMTWKCSRTILGSQVNSEYVQTAQVVLRNKQ
jgi:prepilin-type N-terminal cleavage/methylation domain-containing protein